MKKYTKIIPLGGVGKIGHRNCTIYENEESIIIVDMGLCFPDSSTPGIDFTVSDPLYLEKNIKKVKAIVITHAHYDHIGGLVSMWKKIPVKLYIGKFGLEVIKSQYDYKRAKFPAKYELMEFNKVYKVSEDFSFEWTQIMHSIPETGGLYFKINGKKIFHVSDYRFDRTPILAERTNYKRLEEIGNEKVDMLLVDSTSAFSPRQLSESDIMANTLKCFEEAEHTIAICCFASNVSRILMTLIIAEKVGRRVVIMGGSMQKIAEAAVKTGLIEKSIFDRVLISIDNTKNMPRNKLVFLGTGSQGEEFSAMARLARDEFRGYRIQEGDTLVHSATAIPGNEESVWNMFELMASKGITIRARHNGDMIHASGHATKEDLIEIFNLLRPKVIVPIHGTTQHMDKVEELIEANTKSVPCLMAMREFISIADNNMLEVHSFDDDKVLAKTTEFAIDGKCEIPHEDYFVFRQRRFMHEEGAVFVSMALDKRGMIMSPPSITSKGLSDDKKLANTYKMAMLWIYKDLKAKNMERQITDQEKAREVIRISARRAFTKDRGKKPMTVVSFVQV